MTPVPPHPAPYTTSLLPIFARILDEHRPRRRSPLTVLDPFAGVGRIHQLAELCRLETETTGVELLPKYAAAHERTIVGDATNLPIEWAGSWGAVVTSPCYGNRMADHHQALDNSHRRSYFHYHGEDGWVWENNAGAMQWGDEYRELHVRAWTEAKRVLRRRGLLVVNVKDHERDKKPQHVPRWHRDTILDLGFAPVERWNVPTSGYRNGQNRERRAPAELILVFRKP